MNIYIYTHIFTQILVQFGYLSVYIYLLEPPDTLQRHTATYCGRVAGSRIFHCCTTNLYIRMFVCVSPVVVFVTERCACVNYDLFATTPGELACMCELLILSLDRRRRRRHRRWYRRCLLVNFVVASAISVRVRRLCARVCKRERKYSCMRVLCIAHARSVCWFLLIRQLFLFIHTSVCMCFFTSAYIVFVNLIIPSKRETFRPVRVQMLHSYKHVELKACLPEKNKNKNDNEKLYVLFSTYIHACIRYQIRKSRKSFWRILLYLIYFLAY